jgi:hypothetical protein
LSRWTPSKVRDDALYQSKIIHRLVLLLFWLLIRNIMLNMMFFSFLIFPGIWQSSRCRCISGRRGTLRRSNRTQQRPQIRSRMKHIIIRLYYMILVWFFSDVSNERLFTLLHEKETGTIYYHITL